MKCCGDTNEFSIFFVSLFVDDQVLMTQDIENASYMTRKLVEEYKKRGLEINFKKTEYLTMKTEDDVKLEID